MDKAKILQDSLGQLPVLLFGLIAYFIKRIYDLKSKRVEVNHSLIQQNRIATLNNFFRIHAKSELMWTHLKIHQVIRNQFKADELDNHIFPTLNELRQVLIELKLYLDPSDHQIVANIVENHFKLNMKVSDLYFFGKPDEGIMKQANAYDSVRQEVAKLNDELLDRFCNSIKLSFKK